MSFVKSCMKVSKFQNTHVPPTFYVFITRPNSWSWPPAHVLHPFPRLYTHRQTPCSTQAALNVQHNFLLLTFHLALQLPGEAEVARAGGKDGAAYFQNGGPVVSVPQ